MLPNVVLYGRPAQPIDTARRWRLVRTGYRLNRKSGLASARASNGSASRDPN